ncbi:GntR family transcriptional regulator [Streptomyces sp. NPDC050504]|uniref:GntR family transcriptional regulator n=1 Tax=Streptomyces sp. NPDC050504 TaxID=3365618 RepID=UPI0037B84DB8
MTDTPGRTPLSERARDAVRERIATGRYPQGSRLIEREVAEELAMSRVPVREALRALAADGLLEMLPHSGARVRRLARADVEHLYEVWEPLAVQASRLAADRVAACAPDEPEGLSRLRAALARADEAAARGDAEAEASANSEFHDEVVALGGNPLLARTMDQLNWQLRLLFGLNAEPAQMREQHRRMYADVAAGDADTAGAATLIHVRDSRAAALRSLAARRTD